MLTRRSLLISVVLIGLLGFLQYRLWFEPGGVFSMMRLKKQLALQKEENEKIKAQNEVLLTEVQHIQQNKNAVESRARHELGMIKKDEVFYQVIN